MAEFFDAPIPEPLDPEARTIYIADWAIEHAHRRAFKFMAAKLAERLRGGRGGAAAARGRVQHRRVRREVALAREVGAAQRLRVRRAVPVPGQKARPADVLDALRAAPCAAGRAPRAEARRSAHMPSRDGPPRLGGPEAVVGPVARRLRRIARRGRAMRSSRCGGGISWGDLALRIFVVERGGVPCLVLPMQIAQWKRLPGLPVRLLEPIGMVMDVNRPRLAPRSARRSRVPLRVRRDLERGRRLARGADRREALGRSRGRAAPRLRPRAWLRLSSGVLASRFPTSTCGSRGRSTCAGARKSCART